MFTGSKLSLPYYRRVCLLVKLMYSELLQENAFNLSDSSNLRKLIPFILQDEVSKNKQDIEGRPVAIIFDGTTPRM